MTDERAPIRQPIEITTSRQFGAWLAEQRLSLAFTTYQAAKLFFVGIHASGRLSIFERTYARCMGLAAEGDGLWLSTLYQLWSFVNALGPGEMQEGFDRLYVPRVGYTTGDLDVHDIAIDTAGRPIFVNTLFSCLATVSHRHSFIPLWKPAFVTKLAAEDRCHLNGLAMDGGQPAYVTAVGRSDVADAWREHRRAGGIVIDVRTGNVVAEGLSMPHSPRLYRDTLWLLESGTGFFGRIDRVGGRFEPITFCPGYTRGLAFHGDYAIVGLSRARQNRTLSGLALDDNLAARGAVPRCGLMVIDLRSGDIVHWLRIEGLVQELYDVAVLPGAVRPMAVGFKTDDIRRVITIAPLHHESVEERRREEQP